jgi:hypothetical protein
MNLWRKLKRISFLKLMNFSFLLLQKPLLIFPILNATKLALKTSQELYGNAHNSSGKANAFRHAFWNFILCQKTLKFTKNVQKSIFWTEKVVNYYEKVTKNDALDAEMDFHNNAFGRNHFSAHFEKKIDEIIQFFQISAENAQNITKIEEIELFKNQMVYISY